MFIKYPIAYITIIKMQKRTPHGSCAEVFIREKTEPPEIIDESEALDIIAGASGYIVET